MTARRPVLMVIVVACSFLAFAGPTQAASPQRIYKDLADNGKLDGKYSRADIARAFNLDRVIRTDLQPPPARRPAAVAPGPDATKRSSRKIPFSGLDIALLTFGGGPLLLIGVGLRRRITASAGQPGVARN